MPNIELTATEGTPFDCPEDALVRVARCGVGRADEENVGAGGALATAATIALDGDRGGLAIDSFEMKSEFTSERKADHAESVCESELENCWAWDSAAVRKARTCSEAGVSASTACCTTPFTVATGFRGGAAYAKWMGEERTAAMKRKTSARNVNCIRH